MKQIDIETLLDIARNAGSKILEIYNSNDFDIQIKNDKSPLTKADMASNEVITESLKQNFPDIPILSEEGKDVPYEERSNWEYFWLVDPLDGTKEFIKKNGEFTVNIALLKNTEPILGVIYAPVTDCLYYGSTDHGVWKQKGTNKESICVNQNFSNGLIAVRSRSHANEEENEFLAKFNVQNTISIGSSLKFCKIAEGKADIYYRHGPTMEWDTAAGNAIAMLAGAKIIGLQYNKKNLKNSSFYVMSNGI